MLVYLDTEFTDLDEPNLLSLGLVSEAGDECYVELELDSDDAHDRVRVTSEFVRQVVLPQWGRVPGATCSHRAMGRHAGEWLLCMAERVGQIELISDCRLDVELLEAALAHAGLLQAMNAVSTLRIVAGVDESGDVSRFYGRAERRGLYRHHALADAMALRAAHGISGNTAAASGGLAGAIARGEQAKLAWVRNGEVVPIDGLVQAWGLTVDAINQAERDGEVFSVSIEDRRYVPHEFTRLNRGDVCAVCRELHPWWSAVEKFFFWRKAHGALGGKTVSEAIESDKGSQVMAVVKFTRAATAQHRAQSSQDNVREVGFLDDD